MRLDQRRRRLRVRLVATPTARAAAINSTAIVLTPFGEYGARIAALDKAHADAMETIQAAVATLSNNVEQWDARLVIEKKAAFEAYQAALRAAH